MTLAAAMITWRTNAGVHIVDVAFNDAPLAKTALCGASIPYGEVWRVDSTSPALEQVTCAKCGAKNRRQSIQ